MRLLPSATGTSAASPKMSKANLTTITRSAHAAGLDPLQRQYRRPTPFRGNRMTSPCPARGRVFGWRSWEELLKSMRVESFARGWLSRVVIQLDAFR